MAKRRIITIDGGDISADSDIDFLEEAGRELWKLIDSSPIVHI